MRLGPAALALLAGLGPSPLRAQDAAGEVVAVVQRLFDAMRAKDTVALRAVFHPEATLTGPGRDAQGHVVVRAVPVARFVAGVAGATAHLDEQFWDPEVRVDGDLATVWTPYAFYADGTLSHCGVDAFQLARLDDGWRIIQIADTRRREGCTGPPAR
jgi:uncharacterized protein (TIGR02246 family)